MKQSVLRFFRRLLAFIPTRLPQGRTEFDNWASDLINLYGMPDNDSIRFALAVSILHANETAAYKPKEYFGRKMLKGAANEVAAAVMQELKQKQLAAIEAAKQQQEAAVSAPESVEANGEKA